MHHSASAPAFSSLTSANSPGPLANSAADTCRAMKRELLDKLDALSRRLPPNTLDELIDELGGPDNVAEVRILNELCKQITDKFHFVWVCSVINLRRRKNVNDVLGCALFVNFCS